jgi:hypothetical protein
MSGLIARALRRLLRRRDPTVAAAERRSVAEIENSTVNDVEKGMV